MFAPIFQIKFVYFQLFFCQRSAYFKALVDDHFGETETTDVGDVVTITMHSINVEIFLQILYYIYRNTCEVNICELSGFLKVIYILYLQSISILKIDTK